MDPSSTEPAETVLDLSDPKARRIQIDRVLDRALDLSADERADFLDRECPPQIRADVERMLASMTRMRQTPSIKLNEQVFGAESLQVASSLDLLGGILSRNGEQKSGTRSGFWAISFEKPAGSRRRKPLTWKPSTAMATVRIPNTYSGLSTTMAVSCGNWIERPRRRRWQEGIPTVEGMLPSRRSSDPADKFAIEG